MSSDKLISIAIPCFNAGHHIAETLNNILSEIDSDAEIICYDDGSSDNTPSILNEFQARNPEFLRSINNAENKGVGYARNKLIEAAKGNYLWFIDSDDLITNGAYQKIKTTITNLQPDSISFNFRAFGARSGGKKASDAERLSFIGPSDKLITEPSIHYIGTLDSNNWHPWSRIFKRNMYGGNLLFNSNLFEDVELIPVMAFKSQKHYHLSEVIVLYRQHDTSILAISGLEKSIQCLAALRRQRELIEQNFAPLSEDMKDHFVAACARVLRFVMRDIDRSNKKNKRELYASAYEEFEIAHGMGFREIITRAKRARGATFALHMAKRCLFGKLASTFNNKQ